MKTVEEQLHIIKEGTVQVTPEHELIKKLKSGKKLTIKLGADPTAPDLHLGHAVVLSKMRQLQDCGHTIIFLLGDFTARIGDPTGKSKTRPPLTPEEIEKNSATYFEQVGSILDLSKVTVRRNSEWLDTLSSADIVQLCAKVTAARILEREDFAQRLSSYQPIGFHEFLYPLFQGYDSVALKADIELGGTDQTFNLFMGRFLQEQYNQEPQVIVTLPLLEGLDGTEKMSKSLGNAIGLTEPAEQVFGKLMSLSDEMMWRYALLLLNKNQTEISQLQERVAYGTLHPMALKKDIAHQIVSRFWSSDQADTARTHFENLFQKKDYSSATPITLPKETANPLWIIDLLKSLSAIKTSSEAKRLIESGAVSLDEHVIKDFKDQITWKKGMIIKVGKHKIYKLS